MISIRKPYMSRLKGTRYYTPVRDRQKETFPVFFKAVKRQNHFSKVFYQH